MALGVAVFLSGAALLGVEIVASRVLAPSFGSSLYVWGSLIGVVLTGLAIGYWAGGALSDRYPTPYLLAGTLALGALLVLLVPVLDGWVIEQIVAWDPGPRLDPLLAAIALFAPVSIVLAAATPIAVRLAARSLERLGRTAGRLFSVSTAGSIVGHVRHGVLARARARHRPGARGRRRHAARRGDGLCARRAAAACGARADGRRGRSRWRRHDAVAAGVRPARGVVAAQLVSALPRAGAAQPRGAEPRRGRRRGVGLRRARGARHALPPHVRARRRRGALPPLRQHVPERDAARRPVRHGLRVHRLPAARPRVRADDAPRAVHRARRRLGGEAHVAGLPVPPAPRRRARSRRRARRRALVRAAARLPAPRRSRPRTAAASCRPTTSAGT